MADQYRCEHGHPHYDGDQGVASPHEDGWHHAVAGHGRDDVSSWEPWEQEQYHKGYREGLMDRADAPVL